jgi:hypothetical protein
VKVTDELADAVWDALKRHVVLHPHVWKEEFRLALRAALADVPEPREHVGKATDEELIAKMEWLAEFYVDQSKMQSAAYAYCARMLREREVKP